MDVPPAVLDRLDPVAGAGLRTAIRYDGDDVEFLTIRDDVEAAHAPGELEQTARQLALKGFDDPPDQPELGGLGRLQATVRWFDGVVVCQLPTGEWSGLLTSYDRSEIDDRGAFTDTVLSAADALREATGAPTGEDRLSGQFD